jgi:hypothetical protein
VGSELKEKIKYASFTYWPGLATVALLFDVKEQAKPDTQNQRKSTLPMSMFQQGL